jgi:hypothetical protein
MERIGNYFKWSEFASTEFGEDTIKCGNDIDMYREFKEPIPLTDEWFIKFEFHKDGEYWCRGKFDYKYCFRYRDWAKNWAFYQEYTDSGDSSDDGKKYPISFDIVYVHQLQNIWYSLLHEEITDTDVWG